MAKRKAAQAAGRKQKAAKRGGASRPKAAVRKATARKGAAKKSRKKVAPRRSSGRAAKKARPVAARKATKRVAAKKAVARKAPARKAPPKKVVARKMPALDRARRTVVEEDLLPNSPSSLDMDRTASSARSGARELRERLHEHNETSPAITAGDVDADWESAYSVGDEAPGGDNPTPDQDVVDDIGKALGVQYEDNEELKGEKKISDRDKKRWELDPASAEDYGNHEED